MRTSITRIRRIFAVPVFPDDEDKTRLANVLNTLLVSTTLLLVFWGGIAVPFIFVEKLYNAIAGLVFLVIIGVAYWLMRRGQVQFAGALFTGGLWAVITFYLFFSGGVISVLVIFYLVGTVISGLLLGLRGALIYSGACCLAGLGMITLETSGHSLPHLFPVPPLAGWVDMVIALLSTTFILNLVFTSNRKALLLTRQRLEERKRAEEALRASEEKFRTLIEQASEGFALLDENGILIEWNQSMERIWGCPREQVLGQPFYEVQFRAMIPERRNPERYEYLKTELVDASRTGRSPLFNRIIQAELCRPDGKHVFVEQSIFPIKTKSGYRIGSIALDVTERKRITEEMQSRERFLSIINITTKNILKPKKNDDINYNLITHLTNLFSADYAYLTRWDEQRQQLVLASSTRELKPTVTNFNYEPIENSAILSVLQTGRVLEIEDASNSPFAIIPTPFKEIDFPPQSALIIPLLVGEYKFGAAVLAFKGQHQFSHEEIVYAELASNQIALALWTALQNIKVEKKLKEAITLSNIEHLLSKNEKVGIETVLQTIVESAKDLIPETEQAVLHLLDNEEQILVPKAVVGYKNKPKSGLKMHLGEGIAGLSIATRKTINVSDIQTDDRFLNWKEPVKFRSMIVAPIQSNERCIGVISIISKQPNAFQPDEGQLLSALGTQAAIAIENSRLLKATQWDLKETNALYRINKDLIATVDSEQLMKNVVDLLQKEFGYDYVQIFITDKETGDFVLHAGSGRIGEQLISQGYRFAAGDGIVGYTAEIGTPFFTNNADQVITFMPNPLLPDVKSELAVPIKTETQFLGLLDVQEIPPANLTERDMKLVSAVADQLAVALQKAQLYTDLQNSLRQEQSARSKLIQAEKLAVAGRLLASVSHELNNPLQAIQNTLFLLKSEGGISGQGQQDLNVILSETERMATLIERLRATYQSARAEDFQPVQINQIIEDVHALMATHLRHAKISFEFLPNPELPCISGSDSQLKQVILNLFLNAVDAMQGGGNLTVSTATLSDSKEILVTVTDTGTGINEAILPNIFEAFITSKETGTGLGLAISYEIVQKHHGRIQAENNLNGGATFRVWLPVENGERL
jgi:PAS domain S-box-containing protein